VSGVVGSGDCGGTQTDRQTDRDRGVYAFM
jgi:hypothetical protein